MRRLTLLLLATVCFLLSGLSPMPAAQAEQPGDEVRDGAEQDRLAQRRRRRPRRRRPTARRRPAARPSPPAAAEETPPEEGEEGAAAAAPAQAPGAQPTPAAVRGRVQGGSAVQAAAAGAPAASPTETGDDEGTTSSGSSLRRSNRMEFDPRLIRGETAGTGAVILFDRGRRVLPPLAKRRRVFLRPTLDEAVGPERAAAARSPE